MRQTTILKPDEIVKKWYVVDASGKTLGRLATGIAAVLRGKNKVGFVPFMDHGDFVIVINAEKVHVTGNKREAKIYWRHSDYPGGLKLTPFKDVMAKDPTFIIKNAVKGMLPHNKLGRRILKKLKVYSGPDHPHKAQMPEPLDI